VADHSSSYFGRCVQCISSTECDAGACDPNTDTCTYNCLTNGPCANGYCEPDSGACVGCLDYTDCLPGHICSNNACSGCFADTDCNPDSGLILCGPEQECVECLCPSDAGLGGNATCTNTSCDSGLCISGFFTCQ
jgi:hypothetical protein